MTFSSVIFCACGAKIIKGHSVLSDIKCCSWSFAIKLYWEVRIFSQVHEAAPAVTYWEEEKETSAATSSRGLGYSVSYA